GTRADVGAKVWIIKADHAAIPETHMVLTELGSELVLVDENKQETHLPIVAKAVADGNGSVMLPNIPTGVYTVVMQSRHAKGGEGDHRINNRDFRGRFETEPISISPGQVVDISTDFGTTAF